VAVLTIYHSFHAPQLLEVKVEPGRVTELDVTMTTGRTTGGTVVDPNGNALADVRIVLADWKGHRTLRLGAITDESGLFAIENAPDEEIRFSLSTPEIPDIKEVILKPGRTDHRIELDPAAAPTPPAGAPGQPRQVGPAFAPGIVAPDFTVTTLAGENLTLKDLRGKFVFVDFWATWCPPCVAELPMVKRLHQAMATRDDFLLLSISLDREPATVRAFVKQRNIAWPQVVGETAGATHTATAYQVNSIPSTFLIGPDGAILATDLRGEGLVDAVRRHVDATK
jgi:thiol-disulfide isomerase/thioredoxin